MISQKEKPGGVAANTGQGLNGQAVSINKNNISSAAKNQAIFNNQAVLNSLKAALVSGFGQHHTAKPSKENPRSYVTITLEQIMAMAANPSSVAKEKAQWMIPSTTGGAEARGHAYQRENGVFRAFWADPDEVEGLTWADVVERTKAALPEFMVIVYTSRSATENKPKSRVIIPLAEGIRGADYPMMARILNNRLDDVKLTPDRATERTGQLCYLPNRGEFYQYHIIEGAVLNPAVTFADEIQTEQARLKAEAAERKRRHQEALLKTQARIDSGQADPIAAYREAYPLELALERYGYNRRGNKWLSPRSESGNPGLSIIEGGGV